MISFKLRCFTSIALISFLMGFMSAVLLMNGCQSKKPSSVNKTEKLKAKAAATSKIFTDSVNKLEAKAASLSKAIVQNKNLLKAARATTGARKQVKSKSQTIGFPARNLLKRVHPQPEMMSEQRADSVDKESDHSFTQYHQKDSLCAVIISSQDSLLTLKDSVITVLKSYNQNQADIIASAFSIHKDLVIENNQLQKQVKRQKRKGKLVAILVGVLSGVGVHQITKR